LLLVAVVVVRTQVQAAVVLVDFAQPLLLLVAAEH
jgi:hypothetical protein